MFNFFGDSSVSNSYSRGSDHLNALRPRSTIAYSTDFWVFILPV